MSSSEWQPRQQDPFARVVARVEKIGRDAEQRVNYLLRNAGLRVAEGALHVLQRLVVEGDQEVTGSLDVTGRTTLGGDTTISGNTDVTGDLDVEGRAGFTGDTTIGGQLSVIGALSLPAGIIDNDALANPLQYDSGYANSVEPTLTTTEQTLTQFSIPVPAGFSRALVVGIAQLGVRNTSGSDSAVASRIYFRTGSHNQWSARDFVSAAENSDVISLATMFHAYNNLAGVSQITVELAAIADHTWPSAWGGGTVEAFAIFTR